MHHHRSTPTTRPALRLLAVAAAALFLMAACGNDDDTGVDADVPDGDADLVVRGLDIDFDAEEYEAPAGEVLVEYVNDGAIVHTLVVEEREGDMRLRVSSRGDVDRGTITLDAGEYALYCDVPGHRAAGMVATLTVE